VGGAPQRVFNSDLLTLSHQASGFRQRRTALRWLAGLRFRYTPLDEYARVLHGEETRVRRSAA
jgi:hypothetical protein